VKVSALTALTGANLANGDQFLVTDVGSPNVSKSITADELAQGSQFSGRYKPLASDRLWIPAGALVVIEGSPSYGILGSPSFTSQKQDCVLLDASSVEVVAATTLVPPGWATFDLYYWWSNAGAGSGDVRWRIASMSFADAATTESGDIDNSYTVTAPAQYVAKRSTGATGVSVTAGNIRRVTVMRLANDAADTLGNDAGLIGLELVRAS
jgi:hypothetical protein